MPSPISSGGFPAAPPSIVDRNGSKGTAGQFLSSTGTAIQWIAACQGTVTSIVTGTGLTGGPITATGTIALANTAVAAGSYTYTALTVDAQGRITAAANGPSPICKSEVLAKGNLIVGTAAGSICSLGTGANDTVLTADSACASGVKWATASSPVATPVLQGTLYGTQSLTCFNTGVGLCALLASLTASPVGDCNTAVGTYALCSNASGYQNVAIGAAALRANTSGAGNVSIGNSALASNSTGNFSLGIGYYALGYNTTGSCNIGFGSGSLRYTSTGSCNTGFGTDVLFCNTTGCSNTVMGHCAFRLSTGSSNVGVGACVGSSLTSGNNNVLIGPNVQAPSSTGSCQLVIGYASGSNWITGDSTRAIKPGAGILDCLNSTGTAGQVLMSNGANAICWGTAGGGGGTPATPTATGTVVGCSTSSSTNVSLGPLTTSSGSGNVAIGAEAMRANTAGGANTATGANSLWCNTFGVCNVASGYAALGANTTGNRNIAIGHSALRNSTTASYNTSLGNLAGCAITTGCYNVILGHGAQVASGTGSCQLSIGFDATNNWLTGNSTKAIKPGAGIIDCANSCGTAGQVLMSNGANAICWGSPSSGAPATPTVAGSVLGCTLRYNTAIGCGAGGPFSTQSNVAIGDYALSQATSFNAGGSNTAVGSCALFTGQGGGNVAVGAAALRYNTSSNNVGLGANSLGSNTTGAFNVAVGQSASFQTVSGCCNTSIGYRAGCSQTSGNSNVFIGTAANGSSTTVSNEVTIHNGLISARFQGSTSAWSWVSDARDKRNIENLPLGLEFIESLQPRKFEWDHRHTDDEQGKPASGFIAQEVLEVVEANDAHYANLVDTNNPDQYTFAQANLVPILVNAIKELSAKVTDLTDRLEKLEG